MADNKRGVHFGGGFRYGPQSGLTFSPDGLTVLRYTNPAAARRYERLLAFEKRCARILRKRRSATQKA
jgi:hypothetical protein